ncbi:MAG: hypothetical protein QW561_05275 [Candidatus Aenigmatarchaeota archaeon]
MTKVVMSKQDIKKVLQAMKVLESLNKKYGMPYGENPAGIVFFAYRSLSAKSRKGKNEGTVWREDKKVSSTAKNPLQGMQQNNCKK